MFKLFELKTLIAIFICTLSFFAKAQVPVSVCPFIKAYSDSTICKGACKTLKTNYESIKLTNSYGVGSIQYAPYSFTGTPILVNQDDIWSGVVNMNFPFCFYGQYFTKCLIGANGQITFDIAEAGQWNEWEISQAMPISNSAELAGNTICAAFRDIDPRFGGQILWQLVGTSPCRKLVVSWSNIPLYTAGNTVCNNLTTTPVSTFQLVLYETTNFIDVFIKNSTACSGWNDGYGIVGIQNAGGTQAVVAPGRNYPAQWSANKEGWRFYPTGNPQSFIDWTTLAGTLVGTDPTVEVCPTQDTKYISTLTINTCGGNVLKYRDTVFIQVVDNAPLLVRDTSICPGDTVLLTASGASQYVWAKDSTLSDTLGATNYAYPLLTTQYVVTSYDTTCPYPTTKNITVTVHPPPEPNITTDTLLCEGDTIKLFSDSADFYYWRGPKFFFSYNQNASIPNVDTTRTGDYVLLIKNEFECELRDTVHISVYTKPKIFLANEMRYCYGDSIELFANMNVDGTYYWSGPNSYTDTLQTSFVGVATLKDTGTYTVDVIDIAGCINSKSTQVLVDSLPIISASVTSKICEGNSLILSSSEYDSLIWTGPDNFTSTLISDSIVNALPINSGDYIISVIDSNGCASTDTLKALVVGTPSINSLSKSPLCKGDTLQLGVEGNGTFYWTGPNGFNGTFSDTSFLNVDSTYIGQYIVQITDTNQCENADTLSVEVLDLPKPYITDPGLICNDNSFSISAFGGVTYSWILPDGNNYFDSVITINNASSINQGNYQVYVVDSAGCKNKTNLNVDITEPINPNAKLNTPLCEGNELIFQCDEFSSYQWTTTNGNLYSQQVNTIYNVAVADSGFIYLLVTDSIGCLGYDTLFAKINSLPVLSAFFNYPVCEGADLILSASGSSSVIWSGPNSFSSNNFTVTISSAQQNDSGTYSIVGYTNEGCSDSAFVLVTIQKLPTPTISANSNFCEGDDLVLTASGGLSYAWTGPNGFTYNDSTITIPQAGISDQGNYSVTVKNEYNCENNIATDVVINPLPTITATTNAPICEEETLQLAASGATQYFWTNPDFTTSNLQTPSYKATMQLSGYYTLEGTDANGCKSTAVVLVEIYPLPQISAYGMDLCYGDTLELKAEGGVTYTWSSSNGFYSNEQNPVIYNVNDTHAGKYILQASSDMGCVGVMPPVTVTVNPQPVITASTTPVCIGDTTMLIAQGGVNYSWLSSKIISDAKNDTCFGYYTANDSIFVIGRSIFGCSDTVMTYIKINPLPLPVITPSDTAGCEPFCLSFNTTETYANYKWQWGSSDSTLTSSLSSCLQGEGMRFLRLKVSDTNGCENDTTTTITVYSKPVAEAYYTPKNTTILDPELEFIDITQNNDIKKWQWIVNDSDYYYMQNLTYFFSDTGFHNVNFYVETSKGCSDTLPLKPYIKGIYALYIPTAFTPNNKDDLNEEYKVIGENIIEFDLRIYNRWGGKVFQSNDINVGWNGTMMNNGGKILPADIYIWEVKAKSIQGKKWDRAGRLTLLR